MVSAPPDGSGTAAGLRAAGSAQREKLLAQDCLTTLIELDPSGMSAEVTGSMIGFIPVTEDKAPLIVLMADPSTRIVALTVTEGGDYVAVDIKHDAAHPDRPKTAFGAMLAALKLRRVQGADP